MKYGQIIAFLGLSFNLLIACASTTNSTSDTANLKTEPYYTGSGGKGMSLGILVPESKGLSENQAYLPRMVQGCLVSNIAKYSAISVLDRVSLDKVITETLDLRYEDNLDIVSLGHVAQVGYMMTGDIIRTSTGYTLQINVTDTTSNAKTLASYSGTCTVAELDDFSAIHRASEALLTQMGVQLTSAAKNDLGKASALQVIEGQTALAQGIIAEQKGSIVGAAYYYNQAEAFDPALLEAAKRGSVISASISSGNIGADVRNDIQWRNEWVNILLEARAFFTEHPPFEIHYDPALTQGAVNYGKGTVTLSFTIEIWPNAAGFQLINDLISGLNKTGRSKTWGLDSWPFGLMGDFGMTSIQLSKVGEVNSFALFGAVRNLSSGGDPVVYGFDYEIGRISFTLKNEKFESIGSGYLHGGVVEIGQLHPRLRADRSGRYFRTICPVYTSKREGGNVYAVPVSSYIAEFSDVNANDITNALTVSVNTDGAKLPVSLLPKTKKASVNNTKRSSAIKVSSGDRIRNPIAGTWYKVDVPVGKRLYVLHTGKSVIGITLYKDKVKAPIYSAYFRGSSIIFANPALDSHTRTIYIVIGRQRDDVGDDVLEIRVQ